MGAGGSADSSSFPADCDQKKAAKCGDDWTRSNGGSPSANQLCTNAKTYKTCLQGAKCYASTFQAIADSAMAACGAADTPLFMLKLLTRLSGQ